MTFALHEFTLVKLFARGVHLDLRMPMSESETPYSFVRRLSSEGLAVDDIAKQLQREGLPDDQIALLVPRWSETILIDEPEGDVELETDDARQRCASHSNLLAKDSCTRCGTFVCRQCISQFAEETQLGSICIRCELTPELRPTILKKARLLASNLLLAPTAVFILFLGLGIFENVISTLMRSVVGAIAGTIPWLILAVAQHYISHPWPSITGALSWIALLAVGFSLSPLAPETWILGVFFAPAILMAVGALAVIARQDQLKKTVRSTKLPAPVELA
jgi:hypothetical protein